MKKKGFDRALIGPDSYEYFNNLSKKCQSRYLLIIGCQLVLLLLLSIISTIPELGERFDTIKNFMSLCVIICIFILMIIQFKSNYMDGWQKSRFLAESILSQSWLLLFKIDAYNINFIDSFKLFHSRISLMKSEVNIQPYLKFLTEASYDNDIPFWIKENRDNIISELKEFYIKERINDQERYYYKKTIFNTRKSELYFWLGLTSMGIGAIFTVLTIMHYLPNFSYLGLFTTFSATIFSWKQTKRFEELSSTYCVAIEELKDFKKKLLLDTTEACVKNIIADCEKSISREHKLWVSRTI